MRPPVFPVLSQKSVWGSRASTTGIWRQSERWRIWANFPFFGGGKCLGFCKDSISIWLPESDGIVSLAAIMAGRRKIAEKGAKKATFPKDKSLENWIWDAACSIRGAKDAPKYKDYIPPLIFTKFRDKRGNLNAAYPS